MASAKKFLFEARRSLIVFGLKKDARSRPSPSACTVYKTATDMGLRKDSHKTLHFSVTVHQTARSSCREGVCHLNLITGRVVCKLIVREAPSFLLLEWIHYLVFLGLRFTTFDIQLQWSQTSNLIVKLISFRIFLSLVSKFKPPKGVGVHCNWTGTYLKWIILIVCHVHSTNTVYEKQFAVLEGLTS
jgi:hypothetical protein